MSTEKLAMWLFLFIPILGYIATAVGIYVLTAITQRLWAWVDDSKPSRHNWYVRSIMRIYGYKPRNENCEYYDPLSGSGSICDASDCFSVVAVLPFFVTYILCSLIFVSILQPLVPVVLGVLVALLFIARFVRRLSKVVTKHIEDPDAHNKKD